MVARASLSSVGASPAPSVFGLVEISMLLHHEEVDESRLALLTEQIRVEGAICRPIVVDRETLVILDGHHRTRALLQLGCRLIPAHLVDYRSEAISVECWRQGERVDKAQVISNGLGGSLYPPRTSRHSFQLDLNPVTVPLSQLAILGND